MDGINSGIYELYGRVIRIAEGNDTAGRIIRHRIPPRESIAEASQEIARIKQAILQGAVWILDEFGGLQAALKRSIASKKESRQQGHRRLIHSGATLKTERLSEVLFR